MQNKLTVFQYYMFMSHYYLKELISKLILKYLGFWLNPKYFNIIFRARK
ncbi:hypothetical protein SAMN05444360_109141 [Chryseobacterium carnipullorum]|nr:hypothetical protein SAMN05444360_109141 [Chryseobacterium carnipullorum]